MSDLLTVALAITTGLSVGYLVGCWMSNATWDKMLDEKIEEREHERAQSLRRGRR